MKNIVLQNQFLQVQVQILRLQLLLLQLLLHQQQQQQQQQQQHLLPSSIVNGLDGVIGVNVRLLAEKDIKQGRGEKFKKPPKTPQDYPVPEMTLKKGSALYNLAKNVVSNRIFANLIFKTILVPGNA